MQTTGTVRKVEADKAYVVIKRQSACGENCANCGGCTQKENEIVAKNTLGAACGDCVVVEMSDKKVLGAAFVFYIMPLIIFLIVYAGTSVFFDNELLCIFGGVLIAALFYVILHFKDKKSGEKYMHRIVRIKNFERKK